MFKILKIFKPELWNKLVFVSSKVHVFNFYTHFTHTTYTMHTAAQENLMATEKYSQFVPITTQDNDPQVQMP